MLENTLPSISKNVVLATIASCSLLLGCATSPKIQAVQIGDDKLSCATLSHELSRLDQTQASIDANKGVTGTNVASFLFWLPGLVYTYYDAGEATKLVNERKNTLTNLYNKKNCAQ